MVAFRTALIAAALGSAAAGAALARAEPPTLRVYGPGGPLTPVRGCGERFARARGVKVVVDGGPEERWVEQAARDGDVVFSAAEHVLSDLVRRRPGLVDPATRVSLYDRRAAIIVRKGNPGKLRSLKDLAREGVKLVDVNGAGQAGLWEDLAGRHGLIPALQRNIVLSVSNTAEAIAAWRDRPELDAWITFASWRDRLRDEADLVELPASERLYRGTPAALLARTEQRALGLAFLEFLRSEECHAIFRAAGWR